MAKPKAHLKRAPIVEAIIDFQVSQRPSVELGDVQKLAGAIEGYRQQGPIFKFQAMWAMTGGGPQGNSESQEIGVRLQSADEKYALQLSLNGLTLSRLAPYENWEKLEAEAKNLWRSYSGQLSPNAITSCNTLHKQLETSNAARRAFRAVPHETPERT